MFRFRCRPRNPADRAYVKRCQIVASCSLIVYLGTSQAALHLGAGAFALVLSAISGIAFFGELVAVGLLVYRRFDEFQRALLLRSFLWATVITVGLATMWGFVELHLDGAGFHLPLLVVPAILVTLTAFAKQVIFRQHRSPVA